MGIIVEQLHEHRAVEWSTNQGGGALWVEIGFYADISCSMMIPMDLRQIVSPLW